MTNDPEHESDVRQANWYHVMRQVTSLMDRDLRAALSMVEEFLSKEDRPDLRSDALGMRADLEVQLGELDRAKDDLLKARSLVAAGYARYVHEVSLGVICEKRREIDEALSWYRMALRTCIPAARSGLSRPVSAAS
jgi:hypothetical protein